MSSAIDAPRSILTSRIMGGTFFGLWFVLIVGFGAQAVGVRIPYGALELFEVFLFYVALPGLIVVDPNIPYGHGGQALFQLAVAFSIGSFLLASLVSTLHYSVTRKDSVQET